MFLVNRRESSSATLIASTITEFSHERQVCQFFSGQFRGADERRVAEAERAVRRNIKISLNQPQFDALCSLTYNTGPTGARGTYGYVNANDFDGAASNISRMVKVEISEKGKKTFVIAPGLIKRREEESAPFRLKQEAASK